MIRGCDVDNYDGPVSVERFQILHDQYNVRFNIVGCQVGDTGANYTTVQTANSLTAGIAVPYHYEFLYWNDNDVVRLQRAASFGLPVLIDCETTKSGWIADQYVERIHLGKETLVKEGLYGGIYTGEWWWPGNTRNCQDFKADSLWHAAYPYGGQVLPPVDYQVDFSKFHPYGGWTRPTIWQYADVCYGEPSFDMNMADESILGVTQVATERYDGELNNARALKAVMHNLMLTTIPRFVSNNSQAVELVRVSDGAVIGNLTLESIPDYDQPN